MILGGLQKLTLIDYPGKLAAIIFVSGCSFQCPFCYNPELVLPEKIKEHPKISEDYIFDFLKERKGMLDGVVITGGEPTIHKDLPEFIKKIKKSGYAVKLDTNGSNPQMIKDLINNNLVDYFAMDIKAPKEKYQQVVNKKIDVGKIQKSLKIIKNSGIDCEFRTTVVPTIHVKEDILAIANWIKGAKKYYLQNFRPDKTIDENLKNVKPYPKDYLLEIQKEIAPFFEICEVK